MFGILYTCAEAMKLRRAAGSRGEYLDGKSRVSALSTSSCSVSSFCTMNCARSPTTCARGKLNTWRRRSAQHMVLERSCSKTSTIGNGTMIT